jgi:hypothetical protein
MSLLLNIVYKVKEMMKMSNQYYRPNGRYEQQQPKSIKAKTGNSVGVILIGIFTLGLVSMIQHIADGMKGRN